MERERRLDKQERERKTEERDTDGGRDREERQTEKRDSWREKDRDTKKRETAGERNRKETARNMDSNCTWNGRETAGERDRKKTASLKKKTEERETAGEICREGVERETQGRETAKEREGQKKRGTAGKRDTQTGDTRLQSVSRVSAEPVLAPVGRLNGDCECVIYDRTCFIRIRVALLLHRVRVHASAYSLKCVFDHVIIYSSDGAQFEKGGTTNITNIFLSHPGRDPDPILTSHHFV